MLLKLLYTHLISAFFMTMICYGLYYVFRENFDIYEPEMVSTKDKSISTLLEEEEFVDNTPQTTIKKNNRSNNRNNRKKGSRKPKTGQKKEK